ncbi:MAG TPA: hypothetical protein VMZ27_07520 [Candidatus Saccharimonadales bacterium]|nr:hypothetical protein [Candidatus Saccharimonadales bacterium]
MPKEFHSTPPYKANNVMKTKTISPQLPTLLYFENNERDLLLLRMAAAACNLSYGVVGFSEIGAARNYLLEAGGGRERPLPGLLLVDYSPWAEEGLSLVGWVNSDPSLKGIQTVMCSDQQGLAAVHTCYEAGANYFLAKMGSYARLKQMLHTFDNCLNRMPTSFELLEKLPEYRQHVKPNEQRQRPILTPAQLNTLTQRKAAFL